MAENLPAATGLDAPANASPAARGETIGLLVMAYGTPQSLDEVEPYYTHIRRGRPPTPELLEELIERYRAIGGRSPLHEITEEQARKLAARLRERLGRPVHPFVGYLHIAPFIAEAVDRMVAAGVERAVGLVMAPQYSAASTALYLNAAREALARHERAPAVTYIDHFHDHPGFVAALARRVRDRLEQVPEEIRPRVEVIFTAHSIPQHVIDRGDPYGRQVEETAMRVARAAGLERWHVAYQSAGRTSDPWIGPDVGDVIRELAGQGAAGVLVCPVGFVADHLEVLYDIDIECKQIADEVGIYLARTPSLNAADDFIDVLADLVMDRLGETRHEAAASRGAGDEPGTSAAPATGTGERAGTGEGEAGR